ncbi:MAG: TatD family hydrolase [Bacilli bacterium]|jgi:TatD DNase family protein
MNLWYTFFGDYMLIDTHCHLLSEDYDNIDEIITEALVDGIQLLVINGYNRETNEEAIRLAKKYEKVYAAIGYGPAEVGNISDNDLVVLEKQLQELKVIAVGEIGLDYYWYKDNKLEQIKIFRKQIKLAKKYNKPIIVHCREAIKDTYNVLKEEDIKKIRGIMHCYSSSLEMAYQFIKLGMLIGVGGVITFKNTKLGNVIKEIPLEYIVLETDAPYLTPEPYRGQKNKPAYLKIIANKIAELKQLEIDTIINQTGFNALELFDLKDKI